jgi:membrane protein
LVLNLLFDLIQNQVHCPEILKFHVDMHPKSAITHFIQALKAWPWANTWQLLRMRFREDKLGIAASSLTFTTLISLVPLVTVTLALFTAFPIFASFQTALQKYFLQTLVPDTIAKPVLSALTDFSSKANQLGTLGLVFLVFSALALMLTIDRSLNAIWRVRKPRPIAQRVLVYWAAMTLGPLLLGVSLSMTSYAVSASKGLVSALPGGISLVLSIAESAVLASAMAALFHYIPNTHVYWRHAWAGGLFVSLGFGLAKKALGWYLASVPTYTNIYGAFATVPILLIWIYLAWVIVLIGAVVAAYGPSLKMQAARHPSVPGHRFHLAVSVLRELIRARSQSSHGLSAAQISTNLRIDPLQIEPTLDILVELDWAARLDEATAPRYVLLCDPSTTPVAGLLRHTLLHPSLDLEGFWAHAGFEGMVLGEVLG